MLLRRSQDIKVEGLDVMKLLLERRKEELKEEAEAAEAKQNADREVRTETRGWDKHGGLFTVQYGRGAICWCRLLNNERLASWSRFQKSKPF